MLNRETPSKFIEQEPTKAVAKGKKKRRRRKRKLTCEKEENAKYNDYQRLKRKHNSFHLEEDGGSRKQKYTASTGSSLVVASDEPRSIPYKTLKKKKISDSTDLDETSQEMRKSNKLVEIKSERNIHAQTDSVRHHLKKGTKKKRKRVLPSEHAPQTPKQLPSDVTSDTRHAERRKESLRLETGEKAKCRPTITDIDTSINSNSMTVEGKFASNVHGAISKVDVIQSSDTESRRKKKKRKPKWRMDGDMEAALKSDTDTPTGKTVKERCKVIGHFKSNGDHQHRGSHDPSEMKKSVIGNEENLNKHRTDDTALEIDDLGVADSLKKTKKKRRRPCSIPAVEHQTTRNGTLAPITSAETRCDRDQKPRRKRRNGDRDGINLEDDSRNIVKRKKVHDVLSGLQASAKERKNDNPNSTSDITKKRKKRKRGRCKKTLSPGNVFQGTSLEKDFRDASRETSPNEKMRKRNKDATGSRKLKTSSKKTTAESTRGDDVTTQIEERSDGDDGMTELSNEVGDLMVEDSHNSSSEDEENEKEAKFKTGRWSKLEEIVLRENFENFCKKYNVKVPRKLIFPTLYPDCKEILNFRKTTGYTNKLSKGMKRNTYSIYVKARKLFDEFNYRGRYTDTERAEVHRLRGIYGKKWWKIGKDIQRSGQSVLDMFLKLKEGKVYGPWTTEEKLQLVKGVREMVTETEGRNMMTGIPWRHVHKYVPTRTMDQCEVYWKRKMCWTVHNRKCHRWLHEDSIRVIETLYGLDVDDENDINWLKLHEKFFIAEAPSPFILKHKWYCLKFRFLPNFQYMLFEDIVDEMKEKVIPILRERSKEQDAAKKLLDERIKSKEFIFDSDGSEEEF